MVARTVILALGCLLSSGGMVLAQTKAIQDKIDKTLQEQKKVQAEKDRAGLEELLARALKHNPDIRVAEAKLREADAELHRARMTVFNRIVTLQVEVKGRQAEVGYRKMQYERMLGLYKSGSIEVKLVDEATAKLQMAKADLARVEAELDLLTGKHIGAFASFTVDLIGDVLVANSGYRKRIGTQEKPVTVATPLRAELADKLRKALDTPFKAPATGPIARADVLDLLRDRAKGVNIQSRVNDDAIPNMMKLELSEPVPLGAFFQWAEDQFDWRFVIREYGIVVVEAGSVPPGAMLLSTFWRYDARAAP